MLSQELCTDLPRPAGMQRSPTWIGPPQRSHVVSMHERSLASLLKLRLLSLWSISLRRRHERPPRPAADELGGTERPIRARMRTEDVMRLDGPAERDVGVGVRLGVDSAATPAAPNDVRGVHGFVLVLETHHNC